MAPSHSSLKRPAAALPGTPRKSKDAKAADTTAVKAEPKSPAAPKASTAPRGLPRIPQSEAKKMHQKLKTLKQKGDSSLADKYDKCASQAEKRNFYYNVYTLDPSVSAKAVLKKDIDMQGTVTTEQEGWWTQDQICGHKGVLPHNPAYKELAVAAVAGLEERPHEDPELAKLGLKQYKFCVVEHKAKSKKMQGLELKESVAEVDTDDFHAMRLAVSGGTKQVMIGTKKDKEALKDREKDKGSLEFSELWAEWLGSGGRKVGRSGGPWQNEGGLQRAAGSQHGIAPGCQAGCFEALQSLPWKGRFWRWCQDWARFGEGERTHWEMCCWAQESEESNFCHQEMGGECLGLSLLQAAQMLESWPAEGLPGF